ncbi:helix-turn-helix domain-containing protein [Brevibacillus porteri]
MHPNKTFSREDLLSRVWNDQRVREARTVDVHVRKIRKKCFKALHK